MENDPSGRTRSGVMKQRARSMPGKRTQFAQKLGKTVPFGATLLNEVRTLLVQSESVSLSGAGSFCSVSEESGSPLQFVLEFTPRYHSLVVEGNDKLILLFCGNASAYVAYRDHSEEL